MAVLTGFEGALYYGVQLLDDNGDPVVDVNGDFTYETYEVAHVRNWSLTVTRDVLETTSLGEGDRTYVQGLRGATGTATILYDDELSQATGDYNLWNEIFRKINCNEDKTPHLMRFQFNRCAAGAPQNRDVSSVDFTGYITSFTHNVAVGEVQAATISFTSTGEIGDGNPYPD